MFGWVRRKENKWWGSSVFSLDLQKCFLPKMERKQKEKMELLNEQKMPLCTCIWALSVHFSFSLFFLTLPPLFFFFLDVASFFFFFFFFSPLLDVPPLFLLLFFFPHCLFFPSSSSFLFFIFYFFLFFFLLCFVVVVVWLFGTFFVLIGRHF